MHPPWNGDYKFASRLGFATANVFADGVNVVVKPLRVRGALAMDFLNDRVLHNHVAYSPINSSGVQMTGGLYPERPESATF